MLMDQLKIKPHVLLREAADGVVVECMLACQTRHISAPVGGHFDNAGDAARQAL